MNSGQPFADDDRLGHERDSLDEIERLRADLREALALLRAADPPPCPDCPDGMDSDIHWMDRRTALLAKHKEAP